jgi:hypothetical protein
MIVSEPNRPSASQIKLLTSQINLGDDMAQPVLNNPIPSQIVNERASYGPFDLKQFIQTPDGGALVFRAELKDGKALPKGMILTSDGILTGIPAKDTQGVYEIVVTAESDTAELKTTFMFTVKPSLANNEAAYVEKLKAQVWDALQKNLPIPVLDELINLPISKLDIYYILERWGTLTIWDAFNLDPPTTLNLLNLPGASPHYYVFDRGSSIVMTPKDLFSHERTTADGMQTARAVAGEVYKRGWTIEMAGLGKWTRNVWMELQLLGDKHGKHIEIIGYTPSKGELKLYNSKTSLTLGGGV